MGNQTSQKENKPGTSASASTSNPVSPTSNGPSLRRFRVKFLMRASQYDFKQLTPNIAEFNENEPLTLTRRQRTLIVEGWRSYNPKGSNAAGIWIFKRIFSHDEELKRLFHIHAVPNKHLEESVRFQRHTQVFTNLLDIAVNSLESIDDNIAPLLLYYGSKHAHFEKRRDFKPEYWTQFGRAMTDVAMMWTLERHHREAQHAWEIFIRYIVKKLWEGYELERDRMINLEHETIPPLPRTQSGDVCL